MGRGACVVSGFGERRKATRLLNWSSVGGENSIPVYVNTRIVQVDPVALDTHLSIPSRIQHDPRKGLLPLTSSSLFATVKKNDPSKYLCLSPISDDIRNALGILVVILVVIVPEPGVRRQVDSLKLVLWFACKSTCEPGLELRMLVHTVVQTPEHSGNIVDRDCKEFDEPKFPGHRSRRSILVGLNSLFAG